MAEDEATATTHAEKEFVTSARPESGLKFKGGSDLIRGLRELGKKKREQRKEQKELNLKHTEPGTAGRVRAELSNAILTNKWAMEDGRGSQDELEETVRSLEAERAILDGIFPPAWKSMESDKPLAAVSASEALEEQVANWEEAADEGKEGARIGSGEGDFRTFDDLLPAARNLNSRLVNEAARGEEKGQKTTA